MNKIIGLVVMLAILSLFVFGAVAAELKIGVINRVSASNLSIVIDHISYKITTATMVNRKIFATATSLQKALLDFTPTTPVVFTTLADRKSSARTPTLTSVIFYTD